MTRVVESLGGKLIDTHSVGTGQPPAPLPGDLWLDTTPAATAGTDTHTVSATAPVAPRAGDVWLDTSGTATDLATQAELNAAIAPYLILANPPRARVKRTTVQVIPTTALTVIDFDTAEYNTGGSLGGTVWNGSNYMICPRTGQYAFGAIGSFQPITGTSRRLGIIQLQNGDQVARQEITAGANTYVCLNPTGEGRWTAGQYAFFQVFQESGSSLNMDILAFWCRYICD